MTETMNILVVDDDKMNIDLLEQALSDSGGETVSAANGEQALAALSRLSGPHGFPGIVITDMKMPVMDGLAFLERAHAIDGELPVILITSYGDVSSAVQAMKHGAYDFFERSYDERLTARVARALDSRRLVLENRQLKAELANRPGMAARIVGNSPAVEKLRADIANVASTDASVLIHGETGTGKEVAARCLHEFSRRKSANFVAINCGAVPENMLEAELFGHEAGAFTGAVKRRIGRIEHARGGTVFLDEIESMPMQHQVKILRALEEKTIERLGSNESIPVDFRVVAATKAGLQEAAKRGEFREDLYFRLNIAELHIPPLRDRREDIPLLFEYFTRELAARHRRETPVVGRDEMQALFAHDWPGNVRELRNLAERHVLGLGNLGGMLGGGEPESLSDRVDSFERALLDQALAENNGNIQATMDALGVKRRTLNEKMRKYDLERKTYK
jgi:two-component system C4-dicarboxylate transport response regulator DctD